MTRRSVLLRLAVTAAVLVGAGLAVASPPAVVRSLVARGASSPVEGSPVPPIESAPAVRLAVAGDTGTGGATARATGDRMAAESRSRRYDGLLLLGDLVYDDGDPALVDRVVRQPFAGVLAAGTPLLPVLGNHDYDSGRQQQILRALGRDRSWYVERLGPLRIVVLDSNRLSDPEQDRWLRGVLAEPQPPGSWTVAALHHPPYSSGQHGSDLAVRRAWGPLFAGGVALVLAGHEHDYQRSAPLDGVVYVVSGAGAKLRPAGRADFTAVSASTYHFLDLLAYEDRLVGRAIDHSGRLVDLFTIAR